MWARNSFNFEAPPSGPGPIANLRRVGADASRPILGGDPVPLVGDCWSTNWLAYSSFDGVVVTGDDLGKAPSGVAPNEAVVYRQAQVLLSEEFRGDVDND